VESALLESRYKHLVLLIELKADSVFSYKYVIRSGVLATIVASFAVLIPIDTAHHSDLMPPTIPE
jgi:hypothetical protein